MFISLGGTLKPRLPLFFSTPIFCSTVKHDYRERWTYSAVPRLHFPIFALQFGNVAAIAGKHCAVALRRGHTAAAMFHGTRHSRVNNRYQEQIQCVSLSTRFCYWCSGERFARMICDDCSLLSGAVCVESISKHDFWFSDQLVLRMRVAQRCRMEFSTVVSKWIVPQDFPNCSNFVKRMNGKEH